MALSPTTKLKTAAAIVAALAFLSALQNYGDSAATRKQLPDPYGVVSAVRRFEPAAQRIPPAAEVAYITDVPLSTNAGVAAFLAAQYALAPRLLSESGKTQAEWAVGNFSKPADFASIGASHGYAMEQDLGNGVILYRKGTAK